MVLILVVKLVVFPTLMAFAASSDLFTMTISNRIPLALVAGFGALAFAIGMPLYEIGSHFAAGAVVLAIAFFFFTRRWIGGGDAKLAAATALWFGWDNLYEYVLYASLIGGALTLALLEFRKFSLPAGLAGQEWLQRLHTPDGDIPYGIALAVSALLVYPSSVWMALPGPG